MSNLKSLKSVLVGATLLASGLALGGDLNCPAGTHQAGSADKGGGVVSCVDANGKSQGPYIAYADAGYVAARGTMKDSFREGTSTFFNAKGQKTGETQFVRGRYHGKRLTYFANGQLESERNYTNGRLEGAVREFDAKGTLVKAEQFRANHKVTAAN